MPTDSVPFVVGGIPVREARVIDLGPTHPTTSGLLRGTLTTNGDVVVGIDPQPGALHRGAEIILAARDYRQALSLANRHDWQAPLFGELALARLVEEALGVQVPPRAVWLRALLAEHFRLLSHLGHLTFVGWWLSDADLATDGVREDLRRRTSELTGNRLHPMAVRLGGVACEPETAWVDAEVATVRRAAALGVRLAEAAEGLGAGVAVVDRGAVDAHGLAGPVARASAVETDLRRSRPEEPYAAVVGAAPSAPTRGDASSRFAWLAAEVVESATLVERLAAGLPDGPLVAHLPKVIKLPEGDFHAAVEAPLGRASIVVTSRGEKTPWRLRLRTPSTANVSAWGHVVPGTTLAQLPMALASLPWVAGDLDK